MNYQAIRNAAFITQNKVRSIANLTHGTVEGIFASDLKAQGITFVQQREITGVGTPDFTVHVGGTVVGYVEIKAKNHLDQGDIQQCASYKNSTGKPVLLINFGKEGDPNIREFLINFTLNVNNKIL